MGTNIPSRSYKWREWIVVYRAWCHQDQLGSLGSLTAKLTAKPADDCRRWWTIMDSRGARMNLCGRQWTHADASPAVFKTVCGRPSPSVQDRIRPSPSILWLNDSQRQPSRLHGGAISDWLVGDQRACGFGHPRFSKTPAGPGLDAMNTAHSAVICATD